MNNYISSVKLTTPISKDSYLADLPILRHLSAFGELNFSHAVTFLVGENGSGKSTLLEAIAVAYGFNPEGGTKNVNFSTRSTHSELHRHITLSAIPHSPDDPAGSNT